MVCFLIYDRMRFHAIKESKKLLSGGDRLLRKYVQRSLEPTKTSFKCKLIFAKLTFPPGCVPKVVEGHQSMATRLADSSDHLNCK